MATAEADRDGKYRLDLPAGGIAFAVSATAPGFTTAETLAGEAHLPRELGNAIGKDFVLKAANRVVRGIVKDAEGNAVPGVVVSAKAMEGPEFPASAVTDARGRFAFESLSDEPLIYLFADAPGRGWTGDTTIRPGGVQAVITVGPSRYD